MAGKRHGLVRRGVIDLAPDIHLRLATVRFHELVDDWNREPLRLPHPGQAVTRIDGDRVEEVFRILGPLPYELVAAWAVVGGDAPAPGSPIDVEGITPEAAMAATATAHDLQEPLVPDGFIAIRATSVRANYDALLNDALGGTTGPEAMIVNVQFDGESERGFTLENAREVSKWLVDLYVTDPPLDIPDDFAAAFRVIID